MKFPQALHLIEDFKNSDDYTLIKNIESIKNSYQIFSGNYADFKAALKEHKEKSDDGSMWHDKKIRSEIQDKLVRLMYNFFSSSFTLVYHTRNHKRKLHKPNTVIAIEYQSYLNENFVDNPLHCFVIDFRNFLCHSSLPYIISAKKFGNDGNTTTFRIKKASLQRFKWAPVAKSHIESLSDTFDIEEIVDLYFNKVKNLHEWYRVRQIQFYKDVYERVLLEKKTLLKLATEDRVTQALPFSQSDIEREELILNSLH
ncbi:hypothetical protein ACFS7Z_06070 [Pontibacter toksunensis]|uniref:Uncharacterized protein n=1 Tax=Pontibacter toksunensis TaxID=1332631 RepID=A0ABW6BSI0_9BACT